MVIMEMDQMVPYEVKFHVNMANWLVASGPFASLSSVISSIGTYIHRFCHFISCFETSQDFSKYHKKKLKYLDNSRYYSGFRYGFS